MFGEPKGANGTNRSYLGHNRAIYTGGIEIYSRYGKKSYKHISKGLD